LPPTKPPFALPATFSFATAIRSKFSSLKILSFCALSFITVACGTKNYDITNSSDRAAMMVDARNALTSNNCSSALSIITPLYNSVYSNNDVRMIFASAHGCNIGIQLYVLIDSLTSANVTTTSNIFKTFVRLFPSKTATDSRMESSNYATDALQASLLPGTVLSAVGTINSGTNNPGSLLTRDLTPDANTYLTFIAMASIGTVLNRYGFAASDDPAATSYAKTQALPWTTKAAVQADTTNSGCTLSSGLFNLIDGIQAVAAIIVSGSTYTQLNAILQQLQTYVNLAATTGCQADGYSASVCATAIARLRTRTACSEQDAAASATAGVIQGVNAGW
jgi:hypothetical protein